MDLGFRSGLKKLLNESDDDKELVKFVLEHAWDQWPRTTLIWFYKKINEYDFFKDD